MHHWFIVPPAILAHTAEPVVSAAAEAPARRPAAAQPLPTNCTTSVALSNFQCTQSPLYRPLLEHQHADLLRSVQMRPDTALLIVGELDARQVAAVTSVGEFVRRGRQTPQRLCGRALLNSLPAGCTALHQRHCMRMRIFTPHVCMLHPHPARLHAAAPRRAQQPANRGARRHAESGVLLDGPPAGAISFHTMPVSL